MKKIKNIFFGFLNFIYRRPFVSLGLVFLLHIPLVVWTLYAFHAGGNYYPGNYSFYILFPLLVLMLGVYALKLYEELSVLMPGGPKKVKFFMLLHLILLLPVFMPGFVVLLNFTEGVSLQSLQFEGVGIVLLGTVAAFWILEFLFLILAPVKYFRQNKIMKNWGMAVFFSSGLFFITALIVISSIFFLCLRRLL
ncbi:hypothetical protein Dip510_000346 [Elusimicrobium posterum]|uniref:hypothetical protein n=1 Tax=Elusimicrobium posterum TaxID=3116653 RepID=UPI003C765921